MYLAVGRCLKGKDLMLVVLALREFNGDNRPDEDELASISSKHSLTSYTEDELRDEFKKLTGYSASDLLPMAVLHDTIGNIRLATHVAVLHANTLEPRGQQLQQEKAGSSVASESKKKGKRVSVINVPNQVVTSVWRTHSTRVVWQISQCCHTIVILNGLCHIVSLKFLIWV